MSSSAWSTRRRPSSASTAIELRRRNMIPPEAMPFKSGLTFTYDCGEFAKNLDLALKLADFRRVRGAPRRGAGRAASCAASASRTRSSAPRPAGSRRPRSASTRAARRPCCRARSPRAWGTRRSTSSCCATGSASIPTRCTTSRATPTRWRSARAPAARARRRSGGSAVHAGDREDRHQGDARSPRTCSAPRPTTSNFDDGMFTDAALRTAR